MRKSTAPTTIPATRGAFTPELDSVDDEEPSLDEEEEDDDDDEDDDNDDDGGGGGGDGNDGDDKRGKKNNPYLCEVDSTGRIQKIGEKTN